MPCHWNRARVVTGRELAHDAPEQASLCAVGCLLSPLPFPQPSKVHMANGRSRAGGAGISADPCLAVPGSSAGDGVLPTSTTLPPQRRFSFSFRLILKPPGFNLSDIRADRAAPVGPLVLRCAKFARLDPGSNFPGMGPRGWKRNNTEYWLSKPGPEMNLSSHRSAQRIIHAVCSAQDPLTRTRTSIFPSGGRAWKGKRARAPRFITLTQLSRGVLVLRTPVMAQLRRVSRPFRSASGERRNAR